MSASAPTRSTRQRAALAALLAELTEFRSAQEIHDLLQRRGETVGLSTVYRNLQAMADTGQLDVLHLGSGEAMYRQCSTRHHHHLVCRVCGRTVEIEEPTIEAWARRTAEKNGFVDACHQLEIVGLCADCADAATS
jgi:Fur family transcriptional regulator, ferric uptake regulator